MGMGASLFFTCLPLILQWLANLPLEPVRSLPQGLSQQKRWQQRKLRCGHLPRRPPLGTATLGTCAQVPGQPNPNLNLVCPLIINLTITALFFHTAVTETDRDMSPTATDSVAADNRRGYKMSGIWLGEYSLFCMRFLGLIFIYLVRRAVAEHLRKEAEEAAARKYLEENDHIERPTKCKNLQVAMSIDALTYRQLCVSFILVKYFIFELH